MGIFKKKIVVKVNRDFDDDVVMERDGQGDVIVRGRLGEFWALIYYDDVGKWKIGNSAWRESGQDGDGPYIRRIV